MSILSTLTSYALGWAMDRLNEPSTPKDLNNGHAAVVLESSFKEAASELKLAISQSAAQVIEKIESDKFELLASRIKSLGDLIQIGDKSEILRYQFVLREVVDYAENRVNEGKVGWSGPLLLGKAAIYSALEICAASTGVAKSELEALCAKARHEMVDLGVRQCISQGQIIPWAKVEEFLTGRARNLEISNSLRSGDLWKDVFTPVLSPAMFEMEVDEIYLKVGLNVCKGDTIFDLSDNKAVVEVDALVSGRVKQILVQPGDKVLPGAVLAYIKPE
ncbi:lipoyl domain-containing protein (plasmid) [Pseudomonas sp. App30]|uniref:lipoyl domain-containing protein n=1 Tax=Pseudomonas sp. App30 TaxID=3068990 RepID=UPI003A7F7C9D